MRLIMFASKWRDPRLVGEGKGISMAIAEDIRTNDYDSTRYQKSINDKRKRTFKKKKEVFAKNSADPLLKPRAIRTKETKAKYSSKLKSNKGGAIKLYSSSPAQSKSSYRNTPKKAIKIGKFLGKNKLGLGAVGVLTLGAIGYGVARKIRSDKNKKRGRYFK